MKRLIYQVAVGKQSNLYDYCIDSVRNYCKRHGIDHYVQTTPLLRIAPDPFMTNRSEDSYKKYGGYLPIYEKENAFHFLKTYDQVSILDADIYVRLSAPNIFDELGDHTFAAVCEREMPLQEHYISKLVTYSRMQYGLLQDVDWKWSPRGAEFFNMGLMVMNSDFRDYLHGQSAKEFLERYEFKRFIDGNGAWKWSTDQTLLNWWIKKEKMTIKHLDWRWNALYTALTEIKIDEANFVHFFLKDKLPARGEDLAYIKNIL